MDGVLCDPGGELSHFPEDTQKNIPKR